MTIGLSAIRKLALQKSAFEELENFGGLRGHGTFMEIPSN